MHAARQGKASRNLRHDEFTSTELMLLVYFSPCARSIASGIGIYSSI